MMKKYFAMTIIAASVSLAACSDDDDDDMTDAGQTTEEGGMTTEEMEPAGPVATPGVGGTAFDTIVNSADHQMLEDALIGAGLADTLDNPASQFTIFAPTDTALTAAAAALGDDFPTGDALARVLTYHVLAGTVDAMTASTAITDAGEDAAVIPTILVDLAGTADEVTQSVSLTAGGTLGILVNENEVTAADVVILGDAEVAETTPSIGLVHVLEGVLLPPAAPEATVVEEETETETETETGGGSGAGGFSSLFESQSDATFEGFSAGAAGNEVKFTQPATATEADPWTVFAATDAALAGGAWVLGDHVITGMALAPADLAGSTQTSNSGKSMVFAGTADALTLNGFPVTLLSTGTSIIYRLDGVVE